MRGLYSASVILEEGLPDEGSKRFSCVIAVWILRCQNDVEERIPRMTKKEHKGRRTLYLHYP
jgi:hypothetical protein